MNALSIYTNIIESTNHTGGHVAEESASTPELARTAAHPDWIAMVDLVGQSVWMVGSGRAPRWRVDITAAANGGVWPELEIRGREHLPMSAWQAIAEVCHVAAERAADC